jgi:hypothetical protein
LKKSNTCEPKLVRIFLRAMRSAYSPQYHVLILWLEYVPELPEAAIADAVGNSVGSPQQE